MFVRHQLRLALAFGVIAFPAARAQAPATTPPPAHMPMDGEMGPRVHRVIVERHEGGGPGMMMKHEGGMMGMHSGRPPIAGMFLGHSAELKLTDAQVTRLAAIARRTDDRHKAMRATMDSAMKSHMPMGGDRAGRPPMGEDAGMRAMHERMMAAERADVRDALGVLTVDQQADAWMMRGEGMKGHGPM